MNTRAAIDRLIKQHGFIRTVEVASLAKVSRTYANRILNQLRTAGTLALIGKANRARYIPATNAARKREKTKEKIYRRILTVPLKESVNVVDELRASTSMVDRYPAGVIKAIEVACAESIDNVVKHSRSKSVQLTIKQEKQGVYVEIRDKGVGLFNNLMVTMSLANEQAAILTLLKNTTQTKRPGSGLTLFSRLGNNVEIVSSTKKVIYDNNTGDVRIVEVKPIQGTRLKIWISRNVKVYSIEMDKELTPKPVTINVRLYQVDGIPLGRLHASQMLENLNDKQKVVIDFSEVETTGREFLDELFKIANRKHPHLSMEILNANTNVTTMIHYISGNQEESDEREY